jgi:hypothetical protein
MAIPTRLASVLHIDPPLTRLKPDYNQSIFHSQKTHYVKLCMILSQA